MPLYKPSELHEFLSSLGIRPKKGLSQNFLIDGNIIRKIVAASKVEPQDIVLEIGPGPGSLTEALLEKKAQVVAVEKDFQLSEALKRFKTVDNNLTIYNQDILDFSFQEHLQLKGKKAKVIANLPYHLTTPILALLVTKNALISSLTIMVQDEVAKRIVAKPNCEEYSSFTVFLNFYTQPTYAFQVSKNCFYPVPKVQSAVVTLELKEAPYVSDEEAFFKMVRLGFSKRRKMLRSSLETMFPKNKITKTLEALNLNPEARPENLSLQEWLQFFERIKFTS
jgi:16S rRNA (adenine1518-N6/adenine1519-N6)-dimethyltransferase